MALPDISEVCIVKATKFLATVMVVDVVSNKGDVRLPHFSSMGLKINTNECLKVLKEMVKPRMD